jgi:hypothetical protein
MRDAKKAKIGRQEYPIVGKEAEELGRQTG